MYLHQYLRCGGFDMAPLLLMYSLSALPLVHVLMSGYNVRFEFCTLYSTLYLTSILIIIVAIKMVCKNDSALFHLNAIILPLQICFIGMIVPIVTIEEFISIYALISCTQINHLFYLAKLHDNLCRAETVAPTNDKHLIESSNDTHKSTKKRKGISSSNFSEYCLLIFCLTLTVLPIVQYFLTGYVVSHKFYTFTGIWCVVFTISGIIAAFSKSDAQLFLLNQVVLPFQILFVGMTIPILKDNDFLALFSIVSATHVGRFLDLLRMRRKLENKESTSHACTDILMNPA